MPDIWETRFVLTGMSAGRAAQPATARAQKSNRSRASGKDRTRGGNRESPTAHHRGNSSFEMTETAKNRDYKPKCRARNDMCRYLRGKAPGAGFSVMSFSRDTQVFYIHFFALPRHNTRFSATAARLLGRNAALARLSPRFSGILRHGHGRPVALRTSAAFRARGIF